MIEEFRLYDYRNYSQAALDFSGARLNVFIGSNGAGKSNLLEGIFFIGLLRSFRTAQLKELIRFGRSNCRVEAAIHRAAYRETFAVEYFSGGKRSLQIDGAPIGRSSEFIRNFQPVVFEPEDIQLLTGSSGRRRRFFDMFISMNDPVYLSTLHQYNLALRQRNAALKAPKHGEALAAAFEPILADAAVLIAGRRRAHTELLNRQIQALLAENARGEERFAIEFHPSYPLEVEDYLTRFTMERQREQKKGSTLFGPHLDDFDFFYQQKLMRTFASTGQCRLLALYLKMAAVNILNANKAKNRREVIVLVDDVTGELDDFNKTRFFATVNQADQAFFTFTEPPADRFFAASRKFRVDQGTVERIDGN